MALEIEIDGKKLTVPDGSTIMDAAHQVGTYIPHFCYHKKTVYRGELPYVFG